MGDALHNGLGGEKTFDENLKDVATVFLFRNAIDALLEILEGGERVKDACRDPVSRFDVLGGHQLPLDGEIRADSGIIAGYSRQSPWESSQPASRVSLLSITSPPQSQCTRRHSLHAVART